MKNDASMDGVHGMDMVNMQLFWPNPVGQVGQDLPSVLQNSNCVLVHSTNMGYAPVKVQLILHESGASDNRDTVRCHWISRVSNNIFTSTEMILGLGVQVTRTKHSTVMALALNEG